MKLTVEGMRELDARLMDLNSVTAKRVARRAMQIALQPVADAARAMAPRSGDNRHMADGIVISKTLVPAQRRDVKNLTDRAMRHITVMYVGPSEPHAHLVEFGTVERFHRSGKSVGRMPPSPFMRPAWDRNRDQVLADLITALRAEIDRAVARAQRRAARLAAKAGV